MKKSTTEQPVALHPSGKEPSEYEAAWAPHDPRDRMYDPTATALEKASSLTRVIGSFHPVLNLAILLIDLLKKHGGITAIVALIAAAVFISISLL